MLPTVPALCTAPYLLLHSEACHDCSEEHYKRPSVSSVAESVWCGEVRHHDLTEQVFGWWDDLFKFFHSSYLSFEKLLTSARTDTNVVTTVTHADPSVQSGDVWTKQI